MFKNVDDAIAYCALHKIEMIDFKMTDIDGRWRHVTIPASRLCPDLLNFGIGFDGSNYGFAPVENSDMVFVPLLSSAYLDPFCALPTLSMTGDVFTIGAQNVPFDQYPRSVLSAADNALKKSGVADTMLIGPEFEFHVFDAVGFENSTNRVGFRVDCCEGEWNTINMGDGMQNPSKGGYHIGLPRDKTNDMRSKMCTLLEERGVDIKYHHHEVGGPCQLEIEVELGDIVKMADDTMTIKYVIRNQAAAEGKTATFMPKPFFGEAGNGMHVHMLLYKDGQPVFYDEKGYAGLSKTAMHFMGGLLEHAGSLCAFTNPSTNSFKRLVPGYEAPATIGFATANRSAVIRVPAYAKSADKKRFELRSPDATCNPYYCYAAILLAGLDGVRRQIDPVKKGWGPFDYNLFDLSDKEKAKIQSLPNSLEAALDCLERDHEYLTAEGVFPAALISAWIKRKRAEAGEVSRVPHPVEYKKYFDL